MIYKKIKEIFNRVLKRPSENDKIISRKVYDRRKVPTLYFTMDYSIDNKVLYLKGEEYPTYNWGYDRMIRYLNDNILTKKI